MIIQLDVHYQIRELHVLTSEINSIEEINVSVKSFWLKRRRKMAIAIYIPPGMGRAENQDQSGGGGGGGGGGQAQAQGGSPEPVAQVQGDNHAQGPSSSTENLSRDNQEGRRDRSQMDNVMRANRTRNIPPPLSADAISCQAEAGVSFRYSSGSTSQPSDLVSNAGGNGENTAASYVCPLSPGAQAPVAMDFEVEVKMKMTMGTDRMEQREESEDGLPAGFDDLTQEEQARVIGQTLRRISMGDDEMFTPKPQRFISFEINAAISIVIPAAALVALGLALFRRN